LAARCGLFVSYASVDLQTLLWVAQARAAAAVIALGYALAVASIPDTHPWWWWSICILSGVGALYAYRQCPDGDRQGGSGAIGIGASIARMGLVVVCCAALIPACLGLDGAWRIGCLAWLVGSFASVGCNARAYGRLVPTDMAHLAIDAHAVAMAGLTAANVHPLLPVIAASAWLLRAADALAGSGRRPGSIPAALFGAVPLERKALAVDVLYVTFFAGLALVSGAVDAVSTWASIGASAALAAQEYSLFLTPACEHCAICFMRLVGREPVQPRGRMARRVRAPAN
jgi:hypothetical protein